MAKRSVRIAYRNEKDGKEVKMGRVGFLPNVSHTRVKAHACRKDPAYVGPFPHMQSLKNKPRMQEQSCIHMNISYVRRPEPTHTRT